MAPALWLAVLLEVVLAVVAMDGDVEEAKVAGRSEALTRQDCHNNGIMSGLWLGCSYQHSVYVYDMYITDPASLSAIGTKLCTEIRPSALLCFKNKTQSCANRRQLRRMARNSGGLCGESGFLPWVAEVASKVTPVSYNILFVPPADQPTLRCGESTTWERVDCIKAMWNQDTDLDRSDDTDDLQAKADARMDIYFTCLLSRYRQADARTDGGGFAACSGGERKAALVQQYSAYLFNQQLAYRIRPSQVQALLDALDE